MQHTWCQHLCQNFEDGIILSPLTGDYFKSMLCFNWVRIMRETISNKSLSLLMQANHENRFEKNKFKIKNSYMKAQLYYCDCTDAHNKGLTSRMTLYM